MGRARADRYVYCVARDWLPGERVLLTCARGLFRDAIPPADLQGFVTVLFGPTPGGRAALPFTPPGARPTHFLYSETEAEALAAHTDLLSRLQPH
jgi:hypothetical protein